MEEKEKKNVHIDRLLSVIVVFILISGIITIAILALYQKNSDFTGNSIWDWGKCTDRDNGLNIFVASQCVTGSSVYNDYCVGEKTLVEFYCSKRKCAFHIYDCDKNSYCKNGACIKILNSTIIKK